MICDFFRIDVICIFIECGFVPFSFFFVIYKLMRLAQIRKKMTLTAAITSVKVQQQILDFLQSGSKRSSHRHDDRLSCNANHDPPSPINSNTEPVHRNPIRSMPSEIVYLASAYVAFSAGWNSMKRLLDGDLD